MHRVDNTENITVKWKWILNSTSFHEYNIKLALIIWSVSFAIIFSKLHSCMVHKHFLYKIWHGKVTMISHSYNKFYSDWKLCSIEHVLWKRTGRGDRLKPSHFSVCAVIYGKDIVSLQCMKWRTEEERKALFTLPPSFPSTFARIKLPFHIPLRE